MTDTLSWHNSEVQSIVDLRPVDGSVHILFSAAHVQRHLSVDAAPIWGFIKPLALVLTQARFDGCLSDCVGSLASGELHLGRASAAHGTMQLALPWQTNQAVQLTLQFHNGSRLILHGTGASCEPGLDARFIESYAC